MKKLTILLVDDDDINRMLIKAMLDHHQDIVENIIEANNGAEALAIVERNNINLVLLDLVMPILDGKGFLKEFRSKKNNSNIPVIVLTTDDSRVSEALNHGADDILIKPIKEDDLLIKIAYWIEERQ